MNINIYNKEKGFIDKNNSYFKHHISNKCDINENIKMTNNKIKQELCISNPRICELEMFSCKWKDIESFPNSLIVIKKIKLLFEPYFIIEKIYFDDVGYVIFKIVLKAVKKGVIKDKEELGIKIKILEKWDIIKNEVRKNGLLFEKRNTIEMRIDDILVFYISHNN
jgi:hypothetical protein